MAYNRLALALEAVAEGGKLTPALAGALSAAPKLIELLAKEREEFAQAMREEATPSTLWTDEMLKQLIEMPIAVTQLPNSETWLEVYVEAMRHAGNLRQGVLTLFRELANHPQINVKLAEDRATGK